MYRVPHVRQNSGLCWGCIRANPVPNFKASPLSVYKLRVLQGIPLVVDSSVYLCLSALLFWEAVTQIIWWELYEIWVKKQCRQEGFIMIFAYLLINIACVKDLLVSEMAYERWIISNSLLEEVGHLKSYVSGLVLFCILPLLLPYVVLEDGVYRARINGLCQNM